VQNFAIVDIGVLVVVRRMYCRVMHGEDLFARFASDVELMVRYWRCIPSGAN